MIEVWRWLARRIPAPLAYFVAVQVTAYGTSGKKYGATDVSTVTAMEILKRYGDDHNIA